MQPIFAGAFGPGWSAAQTSYSWGGTVAAVPGRGRRGGSALCAQLRPWGGASLAALPPARPLEPAALLSFWLAPHDAARPLNLSGVQLVLTDVDDAGPMRPESAARLSRFCAAPAGCVRDARGWTQVEVPLLEFGPWAWSRVSLKVSALPVCVGLGTADSRAVHPARMHRGWAPPSAWMTCTRRRCSRRRAGRSSTTAPLHRHRLLPSRSLLMLRPRRPLGPPRMLRVWTSG